MRRIVRTGAGQATLRHRSTVRCTPIPASRTTPAAQSSTLASAIFPCVSPCSAPCVAPPTTASAAQTAIRRGSILSTVLRLANIPMLRIQAMFTRYIPHHRSGNRATLRSLSECLPPMHSFQHRLYVASAFPPTAPGYQSLKHQPLKNRHARKIQPYGSPPLARIGSGEGGFTRSPHPLDA